MRPPPDEPAARRAVEPVIGRAGRRPTTTCPIDDYESLAASQVVDRLPTLRPDELEAVRTFEAGHRGRRTILGKIDQLLA